MEILNKEYVKFVVPQFFNFFRGFVYLIGAFLVLGLVSRLSGDVSTFVHFSIVMALLVVIILYDFLIGMKKKRTYASHKVKFMEHDVLYVDHRGEIKVPYEKIDSYQLSGDTIVVRVKSIRFVINSSKLGISQDELKAMVELLSSKEVPTFRSTYTFVLFMLLFVAINYGLDYFFRTILKLNEEISVFGTLYVCFAGGLAIVIYELVRIKQIKGM